MDVTNWDLPPSKPLILLTGSTGYIGGRLKKRLQIAGYPIRCLVRSPTQVDEGSSQVSYEVGSIKDKKFLQKAFEGVDVAYYLIHSMGEKGNFSQEDRLLAAQFAQAAAKSNVKRIIYLGGLGTNYDDALSEHLRSRHEVGSVLRANSDKVQVIEFRASIVIGSGSLSFEMIKSLVERLPVMITPKWVSTEAQPIGIDDLLTYLIDAIDLKIEGDPIFEIGGRDRISYKGIMQEYAKQKGLKRYMLPVPVLTPRLSSLWLALVTPLYARVGRKLIDSALCETTVHDPLALHLFKVKPKGIEEAISQAMKNEELAHPETRWTDAVSSGYVQKEWSQEQFGGRFTDEKTEIVNTTPENAFKIISSIGGEKGYPYANWLFWLRGAFDLMVGGVGMRRGRKDPTQLKTGDVLDFWRVESIKNPQSLRLSAEMKVPGKAWLEYKVDPNPKGIKFTQKATFDPAGISGILYWYILYPIHHYVFKGMMREIVQQMEKGK